MRRLNMSDVREADTQKLSPSIGDPPLPSDLAPEKTSPINPQAPPSLANTLYVVAVVAATVMFFGWVLWAALVNLVGPPFCP
jgi:hypothetical protein